MTQEKINLSAPLQVETEAALAAFYLQKANLKELKDQIKKVEKKELEKLPEYDVLKRKIKELQGAMKDLEKAAKNIAADSPEIKALNKMTIESLKAFLEKKQKLLVIIEALPERTQASFKFITDDGAHIAWIEPAFEIKVDDKQLKLNV